MSWNDNQWNDNNNGWQSSYRGRPARNRSSSRPRNSQNPWAACPIPSCKKWIYLSTIVRDGHKYCKCGSGWDPDDLSKAEDLYGEISSTQKPSHYKWDNHETETTEALFERCKQAAEKEGRSMGELFLPPQKPDTDTKPEDVNPYQALKTAHNEYARMVERYKVLGKQTRAAKQAWIDKSDECRNTETLLPPLMDDITRLTKDLEAYTKAQAGKSAMAPLGESEKEEKPAQNADALKLPGSPRSSGTKRPSSEQTSAGGETQTQLDDGFTQITLLLKHAAEKEAATSLHDSSSKPDFARIPWAALGLTNGGPLTTLISQTYAKAYTAYKQSAGPSV